jgi:hypothetical protein
MLKSLLRDTKRKAYFKRSENKKETLLALFYCDVTAILQDISRQ